MNLFCFIVIVSVSIVIRRIRATAIRRVCYSEDYCCRSIAEIGQSDQCCSANVRENMSSVDLSTTKAVLL